MRLITNIYNILSNNDRFVHWIEWMNENYVDHLVDYIVDELIYRGR